MKKMVGVCLITLLSTTYVNAQTTKTIVKPKAKVAPVKPVMKSLIDSFSYAVGLNIAAGLKEQGITGLNNTLLIKAIEDVFKNNTPLLTHEQANMTLQKQLHHYAQKKSAAEIAKGKVFLDANKNRKEVTTLPNGLQYEILKAGDANGVKPTSADSVVVNYIGKLVDGTEFDNSFKRGVPATFHVGGVIRGWTEILQLMPRGSHWKVYIPSDLAYGNRGAGAVIPPGATLVFEITLMDVKSAVK